MLWPNIGGFGRRWLSFLCLRFNRAAVHQWKSTLFAVPFFVVLKLQTLQTFKGRCMKDIFKYLGTSWDMRRNSVTCAWRSLNKGQGVGRRLGQCFPLASVQPSRGQEFLGSHEKNRKENSLPH